MSVRAKAPSKTGTSKRSGRAQTDAAHGRDTSHKHHERSDANKAIEAWEETDDKIKTKTTDHTKQPLPNTR